MLREDRHDQSQRHVPEHSWQPLQQAFAPHADGLLGDIPNYTNIQAAFQISEVRMSGEQVLHT